MSSNKQSFDPRQKPPKSSTTGPIDAARIDDNDEASIEKPTSSIQKPSTNMHATKPGPGNEALGQTSKM